MSNTLLKILIPLSFVIAPASVIFFPSTKDVTIGLIEVVIEIWILIELLLLVFSSLKSKEFNWNLSALSISFFCVCIADTSDSFNILTKISSNFLIPHIFYSGFAIFLLIFLVSFLDIRKKKTNEWIWIFSAGIIVDGLITYYFILNPFIHSGVSLGWQVESAIYTLFTILIFAVIVPFAFRVTDRGTFWFLNLLILLLASDFAIRYHDNFVTNDSFSWAETGWCSAFIGLAWLIHVSNKNKTYFLSQPVHLAPIISIRSLLSFSICGANIFLLLGIFTLKLYIIHTAVDITCLLLLLFIFWAIANEFSIWLANDLSHTLRNMFKSTEKLASDGIVEFNLEQVTTRNHIFEIAQILESYNSLAKQTNHVMNVVIETNKKATLAEVASQVSHDIRSPLAALDMAVKSLPDLPEEGRILIRSSISRIKDITNDLLQKNPKIQQSDQFNIMDTESISIQLLSSLMDRLISEKRMQFRSKIGVQIHSTLDENSYGIFSEVNAGEFMRLLSNLINNAVEALDNSGCVTVSLNQSNNHAVISIIDNGKGIPPEIISSLGRRGGTFGKDDGSGLGLYHAFNTVKSWKGYLKIESKQYLGTTVNIMLPLAKSAPWFVDHLQVYNNSKIVILDDDVSVHQIWSGRFEKLNSRDANIEMIHFSVPEQLKAWAKENSKILKRTLFLVDYEFLGHYEVGLDVVEELQIQSQSILITSHFEEINLRIRCEQLGIQLIPKEMAGFVPIIIEKTQMMDAILIDDDLLIHLAWQLSAKINQKHLITFSNADEFAKSTDLFDKNIPIYIDVNLANNIKGQDVAFEIFNLGFKNINFTTGYHLPRIEIPSYIKKIINKTPPF